MNHLYSVLDSPLKEDKVDHVSFVNFHLQQKFFFILNKKSENIPANEPPYIDSPPVPLPGIERPHRQKNSIIYNTHRSSYLFINTRLKEIKYNASDGLI